MKTAKTQGTLLQQATRMGKEAHVRLLLNLGYVCRSLKSIVIIVLGLHLRVDPKVVLSWPNDKSALVLAMERSFADHTSNCCGQPHPEYRYETLECQMPMWRQNFIEIFELLKKHEGGLSDKLKLRKLSLMMDRVKFREDEKPSEEFCDLLASLPVELVSKRRKT